MGTPEYLDGGAITYKSDIYSLGVIIMQIVTGRDKKDCSNTVGVIENWRSRLILDISPGDTSLDACYQQVKKCVEIGMSCMDHDPGNRSSTQHIINRFEKTDVTIQSVRSNINSSYLRHEMRIRSKATFQPTVVESKASRAPTPINTTSHRRKQNASADG